MKSEHTPTPWKLSSGTNGAVRGIHAWKEKGKHFVIATFPDRTIEDSAEIETNAAFIVRAVNCHEELLEACRKASSMVNYYRRAVMTGQIVESHPGALVQSDYDVMNALDKAIAKAEGVL